MNNKVLKHAQEYIEKMANGIDPTTNELAKKDDLINNVRIARCLFYVNSVLKKLIDNDLKVSKKNKKPFYLSATTLAKYEYTIYPISITKIVRKINQLIPDFDMAKLKVTDMVSWLMEIGLLKVEEERGKLVKKPTETGRKLGMHIGHISSPTKEYDIIYYSKETEQFIIDNFDNLLDYIKNTKKCW